jgi:hypothetical protein
MAFTSTTTETSTSPLQEQPIHNTAADASLLSMLILSVYAANKSRKELRKLKRKFLWTSFKLKLKSLFSSKSSITDRQLVLYIIIGVLALALIIVSPLAALIVAMLGLILILTGTI